MTSESWEIAPSGTLALLDKCRHISLTDDEIGRLWFKANLPGVTETQARLLIRAAEAKLREKMTPWRPAE
jgi:hypothetical protein